MPRGYRSIILAAFAGLAIAAHGANNRPVPEPIANSDQQQTARQIEQSAAQIAAAINRSADPGYDKRTCRGDGHDSESDLCAQWTAANAAEEAALYTARAFWAAVVAAVLGGAALIYTIRGTGAAVDALEAQILTERPLIAINDLSIMNPTILDGSLRFDWRWSLKNYGRTGAWMENVSVMFDSILGDLDNEPAIINAFVAQETYIGADSGWVEFDKEETASIRRNKIMYAWGNSVYRDAGGIRWKTGFAWRISIDDQLNRTTIGPVPSDRHWYDVRLGTKDEKRWYKKRLKWS